MDLQVGGASKFNVSKTGTVINGRSGSSNTFYYATSTSGSNFTGFAEQDINTAKFIVNGVASDGGSVQFRYGGAYAMSVFKSIGIGANASTPDVWLTRKTAANFQLGEADAASATPQFLSVQSVVAGTSNKAGENFTITGSQGTGSGAGGSIIFQVAPANTGGGATIQNVLSAALVISSDKNIALSGEYIGFNGSASAFGSFGIYGLVLKATNLVTWRSSDLANAALDLTLVRDAAGTLAQRNGTNAQTFNIYSTYTDGSNYSRAVFSFSAPSNGTSAFTVNANSAAGSGTAQELWLKAANNVYFGGSAGYAWTINNTGHFLTGADNTYDIGAVSATRPRSVYAGTSITPGRGVTVASLPTPTTGMVARVTDALAPAIGTTVAGGGAAYALVNYNGANWTVIGV